MYEENRTDFGRVTCRKDVQNTCAASEIAIQMTSRRSYSFDLSVVFVTFVSYDSRNVTDAYERMNSLDNHFERALVAIKTFCMLMYKLDHHFITEFVTVDAPDVDARPYFSSELEDRLAEISDRCNFQVIRVPRSFILELPNPHNIRFPEYMLKNIAIRRTRSEWTLVLNDGIVLNFAAVRAIYRIVKQSKSSLSKRYVYRMERFDLKISNLGELLNRDLELDSQGEERYSVPKLLTELPSNVFDAFDESNMYPGHNASFYTQSASEEGHLSCAGEGIPVEMLTCVPPWEYQYRAELETKRGLDELQQCHFRGTLSWAAGDFVLGHQAFWQTSTAYPNFNALTGIDGLLMCRVPGSCFTSVEISAQAGAGCGMIHLPHIRREKHFEYITDDHINLRQGLKDSEYCKAEFCGLRGDSKLQVGKRLNWGFPTKIFRTKQLRGRNRNTSYRLAVDVPS